MIIRQRLNCRQTTRALDVQEQNRTAAYWETICFIKLMLAFVCMSVWVINPPEFGSLKICLYVLRGKKNQIHHKWSSKSSVCASRMIHCRHFFSSSARFRFSFCFVSKSNIYDEALKTTHTLHYGNHENVKTCSRSFDDWRKPVQSIQTGGSLPQPSNTITKRITTAALHWEDHLRIASVAKSVTKTRIR